MRILPGEIDELGPGWKGAYLLEFHVDEPFELSVGALGTLQLDAGWYYYVGSALNGLRGRLKRHVLGAGKRHWHIDYLARSIPPTRLWYVISEGKLESQLARLTGEQCAPAIPGFGCSDRPRDGTHLFFSRRRRSFFRVLRSLGSTKQVDIPRPKP